MRAKHAPPHIPFMTTAEIHALLNLISTVEPNRDNADDVAALHAVAAKLQWLLNARKDTF